MEIINKLLIYSLLDIKNKINENSRNIPINLSISLFFIINFIFINNSLSKENLLYFTKLNLDSEITMKIKGTGEQNILSNYYGGELPDIIYVNDIIYNNDNKRIVKNLNQTENIIKMIWNTSTTSCNGMFYPLSNILEIDFTILIHL